MAIQFFCPSCGLTKQVPENFRGKRVKCKCGSVVKVEPVQQIQASVKPVARRKSKPKAKPKVKDARWSESDRLAAKHLDGGDWEGGYTDDLEDDETDVGYQIAAGDPLYTFVAAVLGLAMIGFGLFLTTQWEMGHDGFSRIIICFSVLGALLATVGLIGFVYGLTKAEMRRKRGIIPLIGMGVTLPLLGILMWGFATGFEFLGGSDTKPVVAKNKKDTAPRGDLPNASGDVVANGQTKSTDQPTSNIAVEPRREPPSIGFIPAAKSRALSNTFHGSNIVFGKNVYSTETLSRVGEVGIKFVTNSAHQAISPNGRFVCGWEEPRNSSHLVVYDVLNKSKVWKFPFDGHFSNTHKFASCRMFNDSEVAVVGWDTSPDSDNFRVIVQCFNYLEEKPTSRFTGEFNSSLAHRGFTVSESGKMVVFNNNGGKIVDLQTGETMTRLMAPASSRKKYDDDFQLHDEEYKACIPRPVFSADEKFLASEIVDVNFEFGKKAPRNIVVWDTATGKIVKESQHDAYGRTFNQLQISPNLEWAIIGSKLILLETGQVVGTGNIRGFLPDGKLLAKQQRKFKPVEIPVDKIRKSLELLNAGGPYLIGPGVTVKLPRPHEDKFRHKIIADTFQSYGMSHSQDAEIIFERDKSSNSTLKYVLRKGDEVLTKADFSSPPYFIPESGEETAISLPWKVDPN